MNPFHPNPIGLEAIIRKQIRHIYIRPIDELGLMENNAPPRSDTPITANIAIRLDLRLWAKQNKTPHTKDKIAARDKNTPTITKNTKEVVTDHTLVDERWLYKEIPAKSPEDKDAISAIRTIILTAMGRTLYQKEYQILPIYS